jgi:hypothetical protein
MHCVTIFKCAIDFFCNINIKKYNKNAFKFLNKIIMKNPTHNACYELGIEPKILGLILTTK